MHAVIATESSRPGKPNEDYAAASAHSAVLLDGASNFGKDSGCVHGVAWYSHQLGGALLAALDLVPTRPVTDCVAQAIEQVANLHRDSCDLGHPGTPSSTVVAVRERGDDLEYAVLADSSLVLDDGTSVPIVISDDREAHVGRPYVAAAHALPTGSDEHSAAVRDYIDRISAARNKPGGFWVASTDPNAAAEAVTGSVPHASLRAAVLLSDGASRLMDTFGLLDWQAACDLLAEDNGPAALIERTRDAEADDVDGRRWPRWKVSDDATVLRWRL